MRARARAGRRAYVEYIEEAEHDRAHAEHVRRRGPNFEHAKDKFAAAYAKFPSPNSLANLARAEQLSNHCIDAVKHYRAYVALPPNPRVTDADRSDARKGISACRQTLGTLLITAPAGTAVDVDGVAIALTQENAIEVTVGPHKVTLNGTAGVRVRDVSAEAGKDTLCEYDPKETANGVGTPQAPGTHESHETVVRSTTGWIVPLTLGALGVVGVGIGVGAGVASLSAANDVTSLRTPGVCVNQTSTACVTYSNKVDSQNTLSTISAIGYIAGGVFLAAGIVSFIVWPRVHVSDKISISGWIGPEQAGVFAVGRF